MALEIGSLLKDRYRIDDQLGKGGMGAVYLAFDKTLAIKVALKENLNINPESERQFKREASLLAGLRHPNLPRVTDHFVLEGRQYLIMDFIEGEDLHARSKRQPPTIQEALKWAGVVSDALSYLHSLKPPVIHRDIKPANIKLQPDGNVVLVDFGLAKIFDHQQTSTGARGLTPGYSPPEQYGSGRTDSRSDQYALAATIYKLMTGKSPADSIERMMGNEKLIPPKQLNPVIPDHVNDSLVTALAIAKDDRFPNLKTFAAGLRGEISAKTVVREQPIDIPKPKSRPWGWIALAVAGLGGVVLVGGGLAFGLLGGIPALSAAGGATQEPTTAPDAFATGRVTPTPLPTRQASPTPTEPIPPTAVPTEPVVLMGGGGRIAFVSDREDARTLQIWTIDPEGADPRQLTFGPGNKSYPSWSPDGTKLLFVGPGGSDQFGNDLGSDIWVINEDGTEIKNVTHHAADDSQPDWSPDGNTIVFNSDRINELNQVFTMNASCLDEPEGACWEVDPRNLSAGFAVEFGPAWSPVGGSIAVSASINGAPGRIYLHGTLPGDPTQFDRSDRIIGAEDLAWSPDGSLLTFTWVQPTMNEVYVVRLSDGGATPTKLTNSLGNKEPEFSPDGQWIAFTSTRDQNPEVYLMTANGSNQNNLSQSASSRDLQPAWQPPVSP
jgi:serine/threonine protein kinase